MRWFLLHTWINAASTETRPFGGSLCKLLVDVGDSAVELLDRRDELARDPHRSPTLTNASRQSLTVSLVRAMRTGRSAVTYPAGTSSTATAASHDGDLVENVHS